MRTFACWPSFTEGIEVSSTSSSVSTVAMSEIVRSTVPGLFWMPMTATSPSSTRLAVTIPSMGERTVVLDRVSRAPSRVARAWRTRRPGARAAASAVATAVRALWTSDSGMMWDAKFSSARRRSARAWPRVARADSCSWVRACIENSVLRAVARGLVASIWRRNCPFRTGSPSFTARWTIWPGMVAEMSTFCLAWTFPLAVTLAWRSSRPTVATSTGVGLGPRREKAKPPAAATTTPAPMRILCFFFIGLPGFIVLPGPRAGCRSEGSYAGGPWMVPLQKARRPGLLAGPSRFRRRRSVMMDLDVAPVGERSLARIVAGVEQDAVRVVAAGLAEVLDVDAREVAVQGLREDGPVDVTGVAQHGDEGRHLHGQRRRGAVVLVDAVAAGRRPGVAAEGREIAVHGHDVAAVGDLAVRGALREDPGLLRQVAGLRGVVLPVVVVVREGEDRVGAREIRTGVAELGLPLGVGDLAAGGVHRARDREVHGHVRRGEPARVERGGHDAVGRAHRVDRGPGRQLQGDRAQVHPDLLHGVGLLQGALRADVAGLDDVGPREQAEVGEERPPLLVGHVRARGPGVRPGVDDERDQLVGRGLTVLQHRRRDGVRRAQRVGRGQRGERDVAGDEAVGPQEDVRGEEAFGCVRDGQLDVVVHAGVDGGRAGEDRGQPVRPRVDGRAGVVRVVVPVELRVLRVHAEGVAAVDGVDGH